MEIQGIDISKISKGDMQLIRERARRGIYYAYSTMAGDEVYKCHYHEKVVNVDCNECLQYEVKIYVRNKQRENG